MPIVNYQQMLVVFVSGVAIGKFAMDSGEAFGKPIDVASKSH